jgi:perosamine synthetase
MIYVNEPQFSGNEKKYLNECIDSGWVSSGGPFVKRFETEFSNYIGRKHGVAVCNGTAALEVALYAANIKQGDEVIVPAFTIVSCILAILRIGATPVLVDIEPEMWSIDVDLIESKITTRTKAIMPVHIYGHPVDMDPILEISDKYGLIVIEDSAEVHGAEYKGKKCGALGHISTFSFYANKLLTTGEGGMVLTDNELMAERAMSYRNLCFDKDMRFSHTDLGFNYRMTNLQAAVGVAQLERIDEIVLFKRKMGRYYQEKISNIPGIRFQSEKKWARTVYWMYCIELSPDLNIDANMLAKHLKAEGIESRPFFKGMHIQKPFNDLGLFLGEVHKNTDYAYKYGLYLPSGMTLTYDQIDFICDTISNILTLNEKNNTVL